MLPLGLMAAVPRPISRRACWLVLGLVIVPRIPAQIDPSSPLRSSSGENLNARIPQNDAPYRPAVICFPPVPPPLDRAVSHVASQMPPRFTPPPELAAYINEPFYPPLSTWLLDHELTAKARDRITAFRSAKASALADLRTILEQVRDADPPARRRALETLARQQTPALVALEREAEDIRAELVTGSYDWRSLREWALGEKYRRGDSPMEIAATMRAYAYYQSGLADGQRRLLREISLELAVAGEDTASATANQPFLFFSPEPARVLLPDDLPADLAAKVADYQTKKSTLKKELYDTVYKQDNATLAFIRNKALKTLAETQASRLAQLDTLAEEIRRGLANLPSATRPLADHSALPPVLAGRLSAVVLGGSNLQRETIKRVEAVRAELTDGSILLTYSFDQSGLKFVVIPRPGRSLIVTESKAEMEKLRPRVHEIEAKMTAIADDFGRRYAELINESNAIRAEASTALGGADARAVEVALATERRLALIKESEDAYREYRLAVFEPGLSPEQRRLLFGGALEKLDLPLPQGEFQPTRRAAGW